MLLAAALLIGQIEPVPMEHDPATVEMVETEAGTVILDVIGFESDDGRAVVTLLTEDEWSVPPTLDRAGIRVEAPIVDQAVHLEIPDVPCGRYVATVFHDENGDGVLDMDEESFGHSGDIPQMSSTGPGSGPPTFEALYFDLNSSAVVLRITVREMEQPGGMQGNGGPGGGGPGGGGSGGGGPGSGGPGGGF